VQEFRACGLPPHQFRLEYGLAPADISLMKVDLRTKTVRSMVRAAVNVVNNKAIPVV
jgi:hypothetical protein